MQQLEYKRYVQNLMLCIISIFLVLFFAEVVFRLYIHFNIVDYPKPNFDAIIHKYSENKELIYELKSSFSIDRGMHKTNKYGMRDYEYSFNKPTNIVRICVLGDSVAYGKEVALNQTFENLLEKKLNNNFANKFEVLNFSVTGYNSYQEEIVLKEKVLKFTPDIVIVGFCLNDDTYTGGLDDLAKEMSPYSIGSRLHSKIVSYLLHRRERKNSVWLNNMDKVKNLFKHLALLSENKDFDVIILIFPYYFKTIDTYEHVQKHIMVNNIAAKNRLKVIDFMQSWKDMDWRNRKALYASNDNHHFSAIGMAKIADKLFEYITTTYDLST